MYSLLCLLTGVSCHGPFAFIACAWWWYRIVNWKFATGIDGISDVSSDISTSLVPQYTRDLSL